VALWGRITEPAASEELWLVASHTPWCEGCSGFMASWRELAQRWLGSPARFAALDCHAQRALCAELALLGHPLVAVLYSGSNETLREKVSEWNSSRDGAAREWLPSNWTLGDTGAVSPVLSALSAGHEAREEPTAQVPEQRGRCARALGAVQLSAEGQDSGDGLNVGADWTPPAGEVGRAGRVGDALRALADSLDGGSFAGIRQLSALETWLEAVESRLPASVGLGVPLAELRSFAVAERRRALVAGGDHALCPREWAAGADRTRSAILGAAGGDQGACQDAGCRAWALLYGLAAADVEADAARAEAAVAEVSAPPAYRPRVVEALWSLLSSVDGSLATAMGGAGAVTFLVQAISEGQYGIEGARGGAGALLALWRLRGALLAREALECLGRGSEMPDLRWPPSSACPRCWRKCFRQKRFCWGPWEDQRSAAGVEVPSGFVDALPNEDAVEEFLRSTFGWGNATDGEASGSSSEAS